MKNEIMTFSSEELNFSVSAIRYQGKPAFDAVELAKSLGYTNPAKALKDHCKSLIKLDYNESLELGFGEKPRGMQLAGPADLFRLILRSQLPSAERVQDWVCEEVLPSIAKTGSYEHQPARQEANPTLDVHALARVVAEATAFAMMKVTMEAGSIQPIQAETEAFENGAEPDDSEFIPIVKLTWNVGISDTACRSLTKVASLPVRKIPGIRGLTVHHASFMAALRKMLGEAEPPAGKRKRWHHPELGSFDLRKDPAEIFGAEF